MEHEHDEHGEHDHGHTNVSSEMLGAIVVVTEKMPIDRSEEDLASILTCVKDTKFFSALSHELQLELCRVLGFVQLDSGEVVFRQGGIGDMFYIIISGKAQVLTSFELGEEMVLSEMSVGCAFGELALTNDAPRAATVRCVEKCSMLTLTKDDYNKVLKGGHHREMISAMTWLRTLEQACSLEPDDRTDKDLQNILMTVQTIEFFKPLSREVQQAICKLLRIEAHQAGGIVFRKGESGSTFYVILHGNVEVLIEDVCVERLTSGGAFGELALLNSSPRAATIRCLTNCVFMTLSKEHYSTALQRHQMPGGVLYRRNVSSALQEKMKTLFSQIEDTTAPSLNLTGRSAPTFPAKAATATATATSFAKTSYGSRQVHHQPSIQELELKIRELQSKSRSHQQSEDQLKTLEHRIQYLETKLKASEDTNSMLTNALERMRTQAEIEMAEREKRERASVAVNAGAVKRAQLEAQLKSVQKELEEARDGSNLLRAMHVKTSRKLDKARRDLAELERQLTILKGLGQTDEKNLRLQEDLEGKVLVARRNVERLEGKSSELLASVETEHSLLSHMRDALVSAQLQNTEHMSPEGLRSRVGSLPRRASLSVMLVSRETQTDAVENAKDMESLLQASANSLREKVEEGRLLAIQCDDLKKENQVLSLSLESSKHRFSAQCEELQSENESLRQSLQTCRTSFATKCEELQIENERLRLRLESGKSAVSQVSDQEADSRLDEMALVREATQAMVRCSQELAHSLTQSRLASSSEMSQLVSNLETQQERLVAVLERNRTQWAKVASSGGVSDREENSTLKDELFQLRKLCAEAVLENQQLTRHERVVVPPKEVYTKMRRDTEAGNVAMKMAMDKVCGENEALVKVTSSIRTKWEEFMHLANEDKMRALQTLTVEVAEDHRALETAMSQSTTAVSEASQLSVTLLAHISSLQDQLIEMKSSNDRLRAEADLLTKYLEQLVRNKADNQQQIFGLQDQLRSKEEEEEGVVDKLSRLFGSSSPPSQSTSVVISTNKPRPPDSIFSSFFS